MNVLLDTHAAWWFLNGNERIPHTTRNIICDADDAFVSLATIWEVSIKISIGKLDFEGGIDGFIEAIAGNGFSLLEISLGHIRQTAKLPLTHRDPFDRILIAQSMVENLPLITVDDNISKYDIVTIWKV